MVAKRNFVNGGTQDFKNTNGSYHQDIETGHGHTLKGRFKDAVGSIIEDERRKKMKKKLVEGLDHKSLEGYRKSSDELKAMHNKKIRKFYENQNDRLNDWLEIDTIVRHLADDILDSFDPHDDDGDGIPEGGTLQGADERIEPFLPQDEREKRQKNRKYARWAININVIANVFLLAAKVVAVFFSSSLSLIASLVDSALDLLCTVIIWTTNKMVQWKIKGLSKRFPVRDVYHAYIVYRLICIQDRTSATRASRYPGVFDCTYRLCATVRAAHANLMY